jgi:DNA-binding MarR family transcriptional regulator
VRKRHLAGKTERVRAESECAEQVLDRENYVPYYINMISNKLTRGSSRLYIRKFGIGVIEWRILGFLKRDGRSSANEICAVLAIDKSAASRAIQDLEAKGLVTIDPIDRRQRALSLTEKGGALHDQILPIALQRERILLSSLDAKDRKELLRLLRKLRENIAVVNEHQPKGG